MGQEMESPETNMIMPPFCEICFDFEKKCVLRLPAFLFLHFIKQQQPSAKDDQEYLRLHSWGDNLSEKLNAKENQNLIAYLQSRVKWPQLEAYVKIAADTRASLAALWSDSKITHNGYSVHIRPKQLPRLLYRYTKFNADRLRQLFVANKLYMPSPSKFSDPFDCSLEEKIRLKFRKCAMGCFSATGKNVLMFSHYARGHKGVCLGFDSVKLAKSMCKPADRICADIRPIWYFSKMPPLDFEQERALCATCKHDVWQYEEEYRLFLYRGSDLLPAGAYDFGIDSLSRVIFGCKSSDDVISAVKSMTRHLPNLKHFKTCRIPGHFGVEIIEIPRV